MKIYVLNGVNLKRLGRRQPEIYGCETLRSINKRLKKYAARKNVRLKFFCTDSECAMVKKISDAKCDAIVINPGAWSHYSYAVRDAVAACGVPVVEAHLSDITSLSAKFACLTELSRRFSMERERAATKKQ